MNIFNRKNKEQEEIKELKNSIEILTEAIREKDKETQEKLQDIEYQNKELTTKLTKLEQITETLTTENEDLITEKEDAKYELMHLKEKYEELLQTNADLTEKQKELTKELKTFQLEQLKKEVHEYPKEESITSKKISEQVAETIKQTIEETNTGKKHLYEVQPRNSKPFKNLKIDGEKVYNKNRKLSFTMPEVIHIKEHLQEYYDEGLSVNRIREINNMSNNNTIYRIIWNIEEGNFDELIKQYEAQLPLTPKSETKKPIRLVNKHIRTIPLSLRQKYNEKDIELLSNGELKSNGRTLKYTIQEVISLKEKIPNMKDYPNNRLLAKTMPQLSEPTVLILVWNIEEGTFDKLIETYKSKPSSDKYHILKIGKSYQYPIENIRVDDEGNLYSHNNRKLTYNIYDIIELKRRLYSGKYTLSNIYEGFDYNQQLAYKLIWNIEEGNFNSVIEEFQSRNYNYEVKYNNLYIDGEDTHLTLEKCRVIVDCIVNDGNKRDAINRLIRTYPQTDSKYIRILGEEYNNINLSKILNKETKRVVKPSVNNPQKRREQGYA